METGRRWLQTVSRRVRSVKTYTFFLEHDSYVSGRKNRFWKNSCPSNLACAGARRVVVVVVVEKFANVRGDSAEPVSDDDLTNRSLPGTGGPLGDI